MQEIKGCHVFTWFALMFGVIIAVNVTLAVQAVRTFPGLEVKNSYVASQNFDAARAAQLRLGWEVSAVLHGGKIRVTIVEGGRAIAPKIVSATLGRATSTRDDEALDLAFDGTALVAATALTGGNLNLRLKAEAPDGTLFQQRIIVEVRE